MSVSQESKALFKEKLLTIPPRAFTAACVQQLDAVYKSAEEHKKDLNVKSWWGNPFQGYQYVFRHRMAEYILHDFSDNNELFTDRAIKDLRAGGLYFTVANWLDWDNAYNLHERYKSIVDLTATTGLVLKHPLPTLGAAAAISNTYLAEIIPFIPMYFRKEACQLAADHVRSTYTEEVMPKEEMEESMFAAHRTLNDIAECKINGY